MQAHWPATRIWEHAVNKRITLDALWIFLGTLTVFVLTAGYSGRSQNDVAAVYAAASQLAHHGNVFLDQLHGKGPWIVHVHGHYPTNRFPGAIFWTAPFYLFGHHRGVLPEPYGGAWAAALSAALATTLLYLIFRRLVHRRLAVLGTLLAAFGTSTWSVSANQIWTHGPGQMVLLGAVLASASGMWWLVGLCFSAAVLVRPHLGVSAALLGLYLGLLRRRSAIPLRIGLASIPGVGGLLVYNRLVFGSWSILGGYAIGDNGHPSFASHGVGPVAFLVNVAGTAVSPGRGIFIYSPFLLLLVPGVKSAWRASPDWAKGAAVAGLGYLVAQLYLNRFSGGTFFYGYRIPIESLTLGAPLLLNAYREWTALRPWRRRAFVGATALSVGIQALGAIPFVSPLNVVHPWTSSDMAHVVAHIGVGGTCTVLIASVLAVIVAVRMRKPASRAHRVASQDDLGAGELAMASVEK